MNKKGPIDAVFGGWKISGIESVESGLPFTPVVGNGESILNTPDVTLTPNIIGNPYSGARTRNLWFNPAAFQPYTQMPLYTLGDMGQDSLRGPGYFTVDLALGKTFNITERFRFELQGEAFNAFNRTNLGQPNNAIDSSAAGLINSISGTMRRLQVGGTLRF